jgi:5-methylcytosine-specific restriction endonuclease McrA
MQRREYNHARYVNRSPDEKRRRAEQNEVYRNSHKEDMKEYRKQHKTEINERKRTYYQEHKAKLNSKSRVYYQEHKEQLLEHVREYRKTVQGKINLRNSAHKRRSQISGGKLSLLEWNVIIEEQNNRCYWCGEQFTTEELTIDHVTALSRGGEHKASNIVAACALCNNRKQAKEWTCSYEQLVQLKEKEDPSEEEIFLILQGLQQGAADK